MAVYCLPRMGELTQNLVLQDKGVDVITPSLCWQQYQLRLEPMPALRHDATHFRLAIPSYHHAAGSVPSLGPESGA
jgi:hypothetical protein